MLNNDIINIIIIILLLMKYDFMSKLPVWLLSILLLCEIFIRLVIAYFSINLWFIITRIFHFTFAKKIACNFAWLFFFYFHKDLLQLCNLFLFGIFISFSHQINKYFDWICRKNNNSNNKWKLLLIHYCLRLNVWLSSFLAFLLSSHHSEKLQQ